MLTFIYLTHVYTYMYIHIFRDMLFVRFVFHVILQTGTNGVPRIKMVQGPTYLPYSTPL